jgi:hypothetical protein
MRYPREKGPGELANSAVPDAPAGTKENLDDVPPIPFRPIILGVDPCQ